MLPALFSLQATGLRQRPASRCATRAGAGHHVASRSCWRSRAPRGAGLVAASPLQPSCWSPMALTSPIVREAALAHHRDGAGRGVSSPPSACSADRGAVTARLRPGQQMLEPRARALTSATTRGPVRPASGRHVLGAEMALDVPPRHRPAAVAQLLPGGHPQFRSRTPSMSGGWISGVLLSGALVFVTALLGFRMACSRRRRGSAP